MPDRSRYHLHASLLVGLFWLALTTLVTQDLRPLLRVNRRDTLLRFNGLHLIQQ